MARRIQVTVLEDKEFCSERHYNRCADELSPPLPQLLEEELDVPSNSKYGAESRL